MRRTLAAVAAASLLAGLPLAATANQGGGAAPADPCGWWSFGNGPHHTNAAAEGCSEIDATTVSTLQPRLLYRTRDSVTSTPTVVDGVLYVGGWDGTVYAFDAEATGLGDPTLAENGIPTVEPLWEFDTTAADTNDVSFGRIVGTIAVTDVPTDSGDRRVAIVPAGASLFVLDAATGTEIDRLCLDPRTTSRCQGSGSNEIEVESSPVVVDTADGLRVYVGMDVHNAAGIGRTGIVGMSLDADGLTPLWKFDPEGLGEDAANGTYRAGDGVDPLTHKAGTGHGCAGVWGTPAVDVDTGVIVFGTASCKRTGPLGSADVVGESVFATDLDGGFLWRYDPPRPWGTRTDDDFGSSAQIFTAGGTQLVGIGGKDGGYYAFPLDPAAADPDGDGVATPAWTAQPGQPGHANENFAIGGIIGVPAIGTATTVDPGTGQLVETTAIYATTAISTPVGQSLGVGMPWQWVDGSLAQDPGRMLSLHAMDARTGKILWRSPVTRQSYGHPSYANGVVLVPSTAGFSVQAFESSTGAPLWTSQPLAGAPSSGIALVGDRAYLGAGTRQTDAGYKVFESDSAARELVGSDPQERLAGIYAFELAG